MTEKDAESAILHFAKRFTEDFCQKLEPQFKERGYAIKIDQRTNLPLEAFYFHIWAILTAVHVDPDVAIMVHNAFINFTLEVTPRSAEGAQIQQTLRSTLDQRVHTYATLFSRAMQSNDHMFFELTELILKNIAVPQTEGASGEPLQLLILRQFHWIFERFNSFDKEAGISESINKRDQADKTNETDEQSASVEPKSQMYSGQDMMHRLLCMLSQKSRAVHNGILAKYTYKQLRLSDTIRVRAKTKEIMYRGGLIEEDFDNIWGHNQTAIGVNVQVFKFCFVAFALAELGIEPALRHEKWYYVKRPVVTLSTCEKHITRIKKYFERTYGLTIDFTKAEDDAV